MTAIASAIVRRYPQPWRERYEGEVLALLEDCRPGVRDVCELARGLVVERVKSWMEPGEHPKRTDLLIQPAIGLARIVPAVVLTWGAVLIGEALRGRVGPPPEFIQWVWLGILLTTLVARDVVRVRRKAWHDALQSTLFTPVQRVLLIAGLALVILIASWGRWLPGVEVVRWTLLWFWGLAIHQLFAKVWPFAGMWDILDRYREAEAHLKRARRDVEASRSLEGPQAAWGLMQAEERLAECQQRRDELHTQLNRYGYRARFHADE